MKQLDAMVLGRFDELAEKGNAVRATLQVTDIAASVDCKKFQEWATSSLNLLQRVFGENSVHYRNFFGIYSKIINIAYQESFDNCRAIMQAAREDYEAGYKFELQGFLGYAVLEYLSKRSREFMRRGEKETACVLAGVLLESALKELCARNRLPEQSVAQMNETLHRKGIYQVGMRQRITDWCCIWDDMLRCYGDKYRMIDIEEMLRGVERFIDRELYRT
ncbi:hypothetical protein LPW11_05785 [Geomonas sp. RF6]|uniref:hypothetical protein n=1 Tax=Geomonas sp. RF6 TaxID=2897342 RepID=UPI001E51ED45|nr:hypothetical protein [Geomonas sp. RF6]UFS71702.1 hypothetical protein LPW11_05785 [Geomonas sp. RF6]